MLSNGGAFIYPDINADTLTLFNMHNGNEATVSQEAAGIGCVLSCTASGHFKQKAK